MKTEEIFKKIGAACLVATKKFTAEEASACADKAFYKARVIADVCEKKISPKEGIEKLVDRSSAGIASFFDKDTCVEEAEKAVEKAGNFVSTKLPAAEPVCQAIGKVLTPELIGKAWDVAVEKGLRGLVYCAKKILAVACSAISQIAQGVSKIAKKAKVYLEN